MKDVRDLKDLTIHDVQPIGDEYTTGRRNSQVEQGSRTHLNDAGGDGRVPRRRHAVAGFDIQRAPCHPERER